MISIIIRTYNEEKYLEKLLDMIYIQSYEDYEVIIVDSGSNDKTLAIATKYSVKIINISKEDFTFGYSLNAGIKASSGEFIVMISGHCVPLDELWLVNIVEPFSGNKNVGIVYGKQIGLDGITKFSEHQIFKAWYPIHSVEKQLTPFCNNANGSIRRSVWEELGGYDEKSTGLEDILLADKMLKKTNYYIAYKSTSIVYHIHDETWEQIQNRYYREAITYKTINPIEKFNIFDLLKFVYINITHDLKQRGGVLNIGSIILFRFNQFLGTYKGYKYVENFNELRNKFYYPK